MCRGPEGPTAGLTCTLQNEDLAQLFGMRFAAAAARDESILNMIKDYLVSTWAALGTRSVFPKHIALAGVEVCSGNAFHLKCLEARFTLNAGCRVCS